MWPINIAKMIGQAAFNGYKTGRAMAGMQDTDTNDSDLQPGTIGPFGLRNFGRNLHNRYMHPAMHIRNDRSRYRGSNE